MTPLADAIRPRTLDEVVGQRHLLGPDGMLRRIAESGNLPNMVFYGPSGTGKTTVAGILARQTNRKLHRLNATTASLSDVREILANVDTLLAPQGVLLYLDEIQYFNKKQQQSLLEFMENGKLTLIAATTENPYFYLYNALLSRSTVFEFKALTAPESEQVVRRALTLAGEQSGRSFDPDPGVVELLADACGGDARKAVNAVELLTGTSRGGKIALSDAEQLLQRTAMRYDRDGDSHYDILSAFQKSIRGSDPDAGLHYLARLLEAGDLISPCRRLLVIASEDVGLAYPQAISIVKACVDAAFQLGLPEARLPLAEAVLVLATAPKSNSVICAVDAAMADVRSGKAGEIPSTLQDTHYAGAKKLNRGGYRYAHSYPDHYVTQQYLPDAIKDAKYYEYGPNKNEQAARRYWEEIRSRHGEGD